MGWAIDGDTDVYSWDATLKMFRSAGIEVQILCPSLPTHQGGSYQKATAIISDFELMATKIDKIANKLAINNLF